MGRSQPFYGDAALPPPLILWRRCAPSPANPVGTVALSCAHPECEWEGPGGDQTIAGEAGAARPPRHRSHRHTSSVDFREDITSPIMPASVPMTYALRTMFVYRTLRNYQNGLFMSARLVDKVPLSCPFPYIISPPPSLPPFSNLPSQCPPCLHVAGEVGLQLLCFAH